MRRVPLLILAAALACTSEVAPKNPYDPATPLPLQAKARVSGSVETGAGAPFAQLEVYLRKNGTLVGSFTTDAAGAFVFDALTPGGYAVEAQAPGFAPVSVPLVLAPGADIDVGALSMSPLGGADTGFLRGSAVLGRKVAGPGGGYELDPTADHGGILVESVGTPYAAVTTSTGAYELALPPGSHTLRVSHPSYIAQEVPGQVVSLGVVSPVLVVVLATNPAKVSGQVLGELPGGGTGPLAFATVTLEGTSATGLTNAAGQFTLDQLAPGSYLLRVLMAGYATAAVPVLNLIGGETRVLPDPLALSLERGSIRGQVALADTADASGVVVEVTGSGRAVVTGADGRYAFDALVAGSYEVRARRDGYAQQVVSGLAVTAGAAVDVPLVSLTRQGGTVAIGDGAVTRSRSITLAMGAPSAASWRASEDPTFQDATLGDLASVRRPYRGPGSTEPWQLTDRDGERVVYVVFHDALDGASAPASAAIVLDRVAPAAPSVVIDADAPFTRVVSVGLALSAQDLPATAGAAVSGLARMELADNSAFTGAVQYDFNLAQPWTLSGLDGTKAVYVRFYDRAGNQSAAAWDLIALDRKEPQAPAIALSGGAGVPAGTTGSPLVTATLSATDENEGTGKQDLQVRLSSSSGFAGATWQPFASTVSWLLPPGDGAKRVYAQFMDPAGNQSLVAQADITLAGTAPSAGSLTVASGAAATRQQVVTVQPSAEGAAEMRLFVNGQPVTSWIPYATSASVDLGAAPDEATRLVSVSFRNTAGVEGAAASASIVFDQRGPTAPTVVVNGGAAYTSASTVSLTLGAVDAPAAAGGYAAGLDTVELSQDDQFTSPTVLAYTTSAPWTFLGLEGSKTVYARFRDRAGNLSAVVSATVVYDHTAPGSPTISVAGNAGAPTGTTGTPVVTASLSATDANDGGAGKPNLQMRLSGDLGFAGASWEPYQAAIAWTLSGADGPKTVYAQFRDAAGNVSQTASATITLATTPPSAGSIVVEGGAAATRKASVAAAIAATGATRMLVSVNGVPQAAGWVAYGPSATVDLSAAPDEAAATISVAFRNAGGLEGGGASTSILVDRRAPTAGAVAVNGGAPFTGSLAVTLSLSALEAPQAAGGVASGLDAVELSNDAFATTTGVPMVASLSWTLAAGTDGTRTVSARFKDRAGNVSATSTATIVVDNTAPANPTISLSGGAAARAGYTGSPVVTATLSATDLNDGGAAKPNLQVRLSSDSGFAGATWQPFATSASVSLPGGDGPKTVHAQFRDAVGNTSATASATITLAASPPSNGNISAVAATSLSTTTATLSASNADRMLISVNGIPQAAGWIPYASSATVDLGANPDEATRGLSVLFRNAGGVDGAAATTSIVVDRTPPSVTAGSVVVDGGAAFTGTLGVTVALAASDGPVAGTAASGLAYLELSNDGTTFTRLPWATSVAWTLPDVADGARTVTVRVVDRAGNVSGTASDTIVLDRTGPSGTSIGLAGNTSAKAGYTGTPVVTATVAATDPSEGTGKASLQVRLGNDSNFSGSNWQPYATSLSWVLPVGDGPKDVWVQFKDGVGNLSTPIFATINLMETPPSAGIIAVAGGAAVTRLTSLSAALSAVNADRMLLYVNGVAQPAGWVAYGAAATVDLSGVPTESTATVSVVFRNAGGVDGGDALTSILVDRTAPITPSVAINGGATYAGSAAVTLSLSASDGPTTGAVSSGLSTVEVSNDAFATFQSFPYAATVPWSLLPGPPGGSDGARTVSVRFRDKAGNLSATPDASASITLDTTGPTGATISLAGNASAKAGYTGTPVVTATVSATDTNQGTGKANLQVRLGNDSSFAGSNWQPYATSLSWVLPVGDGLKQVWVQFRDAMGNLGTPTFATVSLMETPPSAGTIAVAGGAASTRATSVGATLGASGADRMLLYVNGVAQPAGWVAYGAAATVDLSGVPTESTATVSVVFRNAGGVDGGDALTSILVDRTAPITPSVAINGGATYAGTTAVTLSLSASDGPTTGAVSSGLATVEISSDAFATFQSFPYAATVPWTLLPGPPGGSDGARTVSVRFRDKAGNLSATPDASASITLDTTKPSAITIALTGNAEAQPGYTGTPVVTAAVSAFDANGGAGNANLQVRLSNDSSFAGSTWQAYAATLSWVLALGDGPKTVWVQFKDSAGNVSDGVSGSIQLLTTPPSSGSIVLASGAAATSASSVTAAIRATGAAKMRLSVDGQEQAPGWIDYATGSTVALGTTPAEATRLVTVTFRNAGGVEGGAASASIRYDATAPLPGGLVVVGTLGNGASSTSLTATPAVTLSITPPGRDETEMAVIQAASALAACSGAFGTPLWQPVSRSATLVLTGVDQAKRACVLFRDAAGNYAVANAAAANITLDTTPPSNPSFVNLVSRTQYAALAPSAGTPQVTASSDALSGGVTYQCTGGQGAQYGSLWVDCGSSTALPSAYWLAANTQSTLGVRARDAAYNYSPGSFVQILHDDVAPFPPFITDLRASRDSATVTWDASADTDVVTYLVYYGNSPGDRAGTGAAQGPSPVQVAAVPGNAAGALTLTGLTLGLPYSVAVEAVDAAGNRSGAGGERMVVPSKVNQRVLSAFGGQPRSVGVIAGGGSTVAYLAENQGIVQLDVSSDGAAPTDLPRVIGRAFLPDLVPDERAELAVITCRRGVENGHCVLPTGTTLEGDYRGDRDAYRAPTPVVFFPLTGLVANAPPAVGTVEALLPVRPHHVMVHPWQGEQVIYTVDRTGLRAFTFKAGQLSALRQVARNDFPAEAQAVLGATVLGADLYAYVKPRGTLNAYPTIWHWDVTDVLFGDAFPTNLGALLDEVGNILGDSNTAVSPTPVPVMRAGKVFMAFLSKSTDTTWLASYDPWNDAWPIAPIELANIGGGGDGYEPAMGSGGYNNHLYVFSTAGMGAPMGTQVTYSNDLQTLTETAAVPYTGGWAFSAYALQNHLGAERLFTVEEDAGNYQMQRFTVAGSTVARTVGGPFEEVPPSNFVEADGFLYVIFGNRIFTVDTSNPLTPNVVATATGATANAYRKLVAHGAYLYAAAGAGGVDVFKRNGDGSLAASPKHIGFAATDVAVVGRWLFIPSSPWLLVYDTTSVATATPTLAAWVVVTGTIEAIEARFDSSVASTPTAVVYAAANNGTPELRTYSYNGATLALLGSVASPITGALSVQVRGDSLAVSNNTQTAVGYVYNPASPSLGTTYYGLGAPTLLQGGYLVGVGPDDNGTDPNGPSFVTRGSNAVDGTLRYSTCGDNWTSTSLAHWNGLYAAGCQRNGITLFTPVAPGGGRLLKASEINPSWSGGAGLAGDGMLNWFNGPGDTSRLYASSEGGLADGTAGTPYAPAGTYLYNALLTAADPGRSATRMVQVDGLVYVLTEGLYMTPTLDVYDPGNHYTYNWTFLARFTFPTADAAFDMATNGEYLYVARNNRVDALDIRNPLAMTIKATAFYGGRWPSAVTVARDRLYVALVPPAGYNYNEVRVWDVSGVAAGTMTVKTTAYPGLGTATGLAVSGRLLAATFSDPYGASPLYGMAFYELGKVDRDGGTGAALVARLASLQPLDGPVLTGDVALAAANQGLATWDLMPWWRSRARPGDAGGVNLPDPFRGEVKLRIDGPWATLVGGTYRVFDLR